MAAAAAAALLVVVAAPRCAAQATSGCTASILSLAPCLSFTAGNTSAPGASCCSALAGVVRGAPRCLCAVLGGGAASLGVTVNATRALELPGKCKILTPPVSQCNGMTVRASIPPACNPSGMLMPVVDDRRLTVWISACVAAVGAPASSPPAPAATVEAPAAPPPVHSTTGDDH